MSWDPPVHSFNYPNGEPQTPTRTPNETSFQTPKLESSFFDPRVTWNTADPYASSPEFLRTPQRFGLTTPSNKRNSLGRGTNLSPADALNTQTSPFLSRKSVESSIRKGASKAGEYEGEGSKAIDSAKRSAASMQTPPPTSTARRRIQERNTPRTARDMTLQPPDSSHLETPSRVSGMSSHLFDSHDSTDLFQVDGANPSGSPFFPQNRLFWDQDSELDRGLGISEAYGDPFGPTATTQPMLDVTTNHDPMMNDDLPMPQLQTIQEAAKISHFSNDSSFMPSSTADGGSLYLNSFSTSPRGPPPRQDDPAMFLSSPARRFGFSDPAVSPERPALETRQPYYYQNEDFRREKKRKEMKRAKSLGRRKTDSVDESVPPLIGPPKSARPAARRISTHTGVAPLAHSRQVSQQSFTSPVSINSGVKKTPSRGRSSPLKSYMATSRPSSATVPAPMESLVLKIGKDGRAKTEMKVLNPSPTRLPTSDIDVDGSSTESDTDSSDEPDRPTASFMQNPSFNVPDLTPRRPSIVRSHSTSRPHSKSSSYSSTVASSHSGRHSPWTSSSRGSGRRSGMAGPQEPWSQSRRSWMTPRGAHSCGPSATDSDVTQEDDEDDDTGDAQHALKQVLKGRARQTRPMAPLSASRASKHMSALPSSPPPYGNLDPRMGYTSSPTTLTDPDIATPMADRQSNPSNGTRCVCNSMDNGGHLMIQCESCTHWLHTKCVGLDRQSLPPVYICVYCSQTPMRGGRIRERFAGPAHAPSSPLAHKSYGRR